MSNRLSALPLILAPLVWGGCDALGSSERYLEGEPIPGTATAFEISDESTYSLGEGDPKVSPEGQRLAFRRGGKIWVLDIQTGRQQEVAIGRDADWSPDGVWLVHASTGISKTRLDGSERVLLSPDGFSSDWSPDGNRIAYDRSLQDETGPAGTWVMNADGTERRPICGAFMPDWLPDSQALLALQGRDDQSYEFVRCDVASSTEEGTIQLPDISSPTFTRPRVSPDGSRLVYEGPHGIWVAAADGSWAQRILPTHLGNPDFDYEGDEPTIAAVSPSWHPDGQHIVYEHLRITSRERARLGYGPVIRGEVTYRLLNVEAALDAADL